MKIEISANKRELQGTGASRRLRNAGKVPGIVYGGTTNPVNIELNHKELAQNLSKEAFHASILTLDLDGKKEQVLLRSFNMHPFKLQVQHIDFQRVSKDRKIHMKVPFHFVNAELSPAIKEQGGVVSHVLNELNITCLPDDLPEYIEIDLSTATVGYSVHAKDIKLPKGVEAVLHKKENPVVVSVLVPQLAQVEEETTVAAAPAAGDVPASKQAEPAKEGDKAADAKGGAKAADKGATKPAAGGGDKKDKK
jgi:large subunit ribosomal protein L25